MMKTSLQPFQAFIDKAIDRIQEDPEALGLAIGGSWASGEIDAYSDLDLVWVTTQPVAPDLALMRSYAARFGSVLASFRGDHVGERRLLIVLYESPLLHVDIKFLTLPEFYERVEDPVIVWERNGLLTAVVEQSTAQYPAFDYQWTEDRFWVWIHYVALKIGRGEYWEATDFLGFLRTVVLGPMLLLKKGHLPRGVRRLETVADSADLERLRATLATPDREALCNSLQACVQLYIELRDALAPATLDRNEAAQVTVQRLLTSL